MVNNMLGFVVGQDPRAELAKMKKLLSQPKKLAEHLRETRERAKRYADLEISSLLREPL